MRKERVPLGEGRSYDILIGGALLRESGARIGALGRRALIVTQKKVFDRHGSKLTDALDGAGVDWKKMTLPDGERYKNMAAIGKIHDRLAAGRYDRQSLIIALGGGVVGDIAGFAAATWMRGMPIIQAPTTLLAQVDSSVGGKTGVNHPGGKNMIGAFHQPKLVLADTDALETLPEKEFRCGVAEVIKYGCIASARFFGFLEKSGERLMRRDPQVMASVIRTCCRIKAGVVAADERESGGRAILNFGHTIGHAIEAVTRYRRYTHGEAVAIGMAVAARISAIKGGITMAQVERIDQLIASAGLANRVPQGLATAELIKAMRHDKKVANGALRFALLDKLGSCVVRADVTHKEIGDALRGAAANTRG